MKTIWTKIKLFFSNLFKNYKLYGIIILAFILLILFFKVRIGSLERQKAELIDENKVKNALIDTIHTYKNKLGEITSEKLTLQLKLSDLKLYNNQLNDSQKELFSRIDELTNKNNLITAALVKSKFTIDSLMLAVNGKVDSIDNTINFENALADINIDVTVFNVKPFNALQPTKLLINNLSFDNKQFIDFNWGDKKEGYPISFSITNSNKYMKTVDIQSYAIPELKKPLIKPNFWQKVKGFFGDTKNAVIKVGIGIGVGYLLFHK